MVLAYMRNEKKGSLDGRTIDKINIIPSNEGWKDNGGCLVRGAVSVGCGREHPSIDKHSSNLAAALKEREPQLRGI